eukprot:768548-Hanusia_phi.AAC.2
MQHTSSFAVLFLAFIPGRISAHFRFSCPSPSLIPTTTMAEEAIAEYAAAAVCMVLAGLVLLFGSRRSPPPARVVGDGDKDGNKDDGRIERSQAATRRVDVSAAREHGRSFMARSSSSVHARSLRSSLRSGLIQEDADGGAASFFEEMLKCFGFEDTGEHGFGFSVSSKSRPLPADFPLVEKVRSDLMASTSLGNGDRILMVDSQHVAGMRAKEVKSLISQSDFRISLLVKSSEGGGGQVERQVVLYRGRVGVLRTFFTNYMLKHSNGYQSTPVVSLYDCLPAFHRSLALMTLVWQGQEIAQVFRLFMTLSDQVASADELVSLLQHSISARPKGSIQKSVLSIIKVLVVYQATECLHASNIDVSPMRESEVRCPSAYSSTHVDATDASPLRLSMLEFQRSQVTDNLRKELEKLQEEAATREAELEATRKEVQRLAEELSKARGLAAAVKADDQGTTYRDAREEAETSSRLEGLERSFNGFVDWTEDFHHRLFAVMEEGTSIRQDAYKTKDVSPPEQKIADPPPTRSHEDELLDLCRRSLTSMCELMRGRSGGEQEEDLLQELGFLHQELRFVMDEQRAEAFAAEDLRIYLQETLDALTTAHTNSFNFMSRFDFLLSKLKFYRRRNASLHRMQATSAPGILHSRSISEIDRSPACLLDELGYQDRRSSNEFSQDGEDGLVEVLEQLLIAINSDGDEHLDRSLPPPQDSLFTSHSGAGAEGGGGEVEEEKELEALRRRISDMEQMIRFRESSYNLLLHFCSTELRALLGEPCSPSASPSLPSSSMSFTPSSVDYNNYNAMGPPGKKKLEELFDALKRRRYFMPGHQI